MQRFVLRSSLHQGSATFYALRTDIRLALFGGTALKKIMNVCHLQIHYNL